MSSAAAVQAQVAAEPYLGLRPFEEDDSELFFGREAHTDELLSRLARTRFIAVVGTSGSGKSSLVKAGLLPALHAGYLAEVGSHWRTVIFRPGEDPTGRLAEQLFAKLPQGTVGDEEFRRSMVLATLERSSRGLLDVIEQAHLEPQENVLLVVDQFEELFRYAGSSWRDRDQRAAFVKLLLEAGAPADRRINVMITMRADFLGDCSQFPGLAEAVNNGLYLVPRMTRDQLQQAITGPALVSGGKLTQNLVQRLLNDAGDEPDQLPLLQHALRRTWEYWSRRGAPGEPLDVPDYEHIGGMATALSKHANDLLQGLDSENRELARRMFQSITERGSDNREVRRPAELHKIAQASGADERALAAVIDCFRAPGAAFLMPPYGTPLNSKTIVDISHESLIRKWDMLREWVTADAESREKYHKLATAARSNFRIQKPQLQLFLDWWLKEKPTCGWARTDQASFAAVKEFLDDCAREVETAERKEAERQRWRKRRPLIYGAIAVVPMFFLVVVSLMLDAVRGRVSADALIAAQKNSGIELSSLLAIRAINMTPWGRSSDIGLQLRRNVALMPFETKRFAPPGDAKLKIALASRAGQFSLIGFDDGTVAIRKWGATQERRRKLAAGSIFLLAVSRDGSMVAAADLEESAGVWTSDTMQELRHWHRTDGYSAIALSPSGRNAALGRTDGTVTLAGLGKNGNERDIAHLQGNVTVLQFSPDGSKLVAATANKNGKSEAAFFDAGTGRLLWRFSRPLPGFQFQAVVFDPLPHPYLVLAGSTLSGFQEASDGNVFLLKTDELGKEAGTRFHGKGTFNVAFSDDGKYLATSGGDRTVRVWNGLFGEMMNEFHFEGNISALTFTGNSKYLGVGSQDNTARLFQLPIGQEVARVAAPGEVWGVFFEPVADQKTMVMDAVSEKGILRASFRFHSPPDDVIQKWDAGGKRAEPYAIDVKDRRLTVGGAVFAEDLPSNAVWADWQAVDENKRYIAIGFPDRVARIYDLAAKKMINSMPLDDRVTDGYLETDGTLYTRTLVEPNPKLYSYRRYPASIMKVVEQACGSLSRDLTHEERRKIFGWFPHWSKTCPNLPPAVER